MNIEWNAKKYDESFDFVHKYGNDLLQLIDVKEGMSALDLGCGNGVLTKALADMGMNVIGMDASADQLGIARKNYPELCFIQGDATDFKLEKKVDVVFSNAVFHWIDHSKQAFMMDCVFSNVLNEGGQFIFEFGGNGSCKMIHSALAKAFHNRGLCYKNTFYFPAIGEYTAALERVGFKVIYATLFDRKTPLKGEDGMKDWIEMFLKAPFDGLDEQLKQEIICEVVENLRDKLYQDGVWYADYVRIRVKAVK